MKKAIVYLGMVFLFQSCDRDKYRIGRFPEEPINVKEVNSPYDDINSDIPYIGHNVKLVFSTNRANPQNQDFSLVLSYLDFNWDKSDGFLMISPTNVLFDKEFESFREMIQRTVSPAHEKGPYSFIENESSRVILFSREVDGIYSVFAEWETAFSNAKTTQIFRILDEKSSEMYPSLYGKDFLKGLDANPSYPEMLVFSSDKDGKFDIYESDIPAGQSPMDFLASSNLKTVRKLELNTSSNDHMPFVYGNLLVFSSDRPGGFGGYDLYYSLKTADGWDEPVNFGPKINSEFDEFRPVVSDAVDFSNRLMIFSSNRPGGLGGFDLYFVGIGKF